MLRKEIMEQDIRVKDLGKELKKLWDYDEENLERNLGKFFSQLKFGSEESIILKELLKKYIYITEEKEKEYLVKFHKIIDKLDKTRTMFSYIESKDEKINSSNGILNEYKRIYKISNNASYKITKLKDYVIENLILFDDISGTGSTIIDFFKKYLQILKEKDSLKIYLLVYIISEKAHEEIIKFCGEQGINIIIEHIILVKKCFEKGYIYYDEAYEKEKIIRKLEEKICGDKGKEYILGYKNSQLLVSLHRNTPNNTLSSFWYENSRWKGLFPREKMILTKIDRKKLSNQKRKYKKEI